MYVIFKFDSNNFFLYFPFRTLTRERSVLALTINTFFNGRAISALVASRTTQVSVPRQLVLEWPKRWHLKHLNVLEMYDLTEQRKYPALTYSGNRGVLNDNMKCLVGTSSPSRRMLMRRTSLAP
ncbi:hypothetical protein AVEN_15744-1 [Araneus ventricosus]|uniref:Uncharacterized protein n=1 Tax=Araneus ventricosus TaxID=182803 RepID=A0A4Y2R190_ARAVE|nr:hypothetical protein AVEN_15744-1 [Araneus ventricosus]